ncbi:MAG TPA: bifunctional glycosyltransferase/class I SAM-dependent methyltransferase [Jatrophihabitans sp.]|uniref:methyltransferase domain-containing protein n=1 Tax=Jatrophihabitans sp. TaxID=1932789 RepID=UPI002F23C45C
MQPDLAGPPYRPDDAGHDRPDAGHDRLKIGVLVVAFNAESTLQATLDRIPDAMRARIDEILICDDASQDGTVDAGLAWREANEAIPTTVIRHVSNLGYGGNQKAGYQLAQERGLDLIVLLHADGQYAPEAMADLLAPLERGEADAVFGSRMLEPGSARAGGMPLYKYLGNRVLTTFENRLLDSKLSEFHSGYRAYRVSALAELPIAFNTDDFDFDTQIIIQLLDAGKRIVEVPIPTYYGEEICYVDGLKYARDVVRDVLQYRLTKVGIGTHRWVPADPEYAAKEGEGTSHTVITEMLAAMPSGRRVLDLGCSGGRLSERIRQLGHKVVGVDSLEIAGVRNRVDDFFLGDLEDGIPEAAGGDFDVVVAADVIEHVRYPERLLRQMTEVLSPNGQIVISTPNFGHWYSRGRVAVGAFDYDRRGILDETHLRFFSRKSLRRTIGSAGLDVLQLEYTGLPLEVLTRTDSWKARSARVVDRRLVQLRPTMFGYQFVARLRPHHAGSITHRA